MKVRGLFLSSALTISAAVGLNALTCLPGLISPALAGLPGAPVTHIAGAPVAASNDLDARQGTMHERVRAAIEAGRLTDANMHSINDQLQKVAAEEAAFRAKNGELTRSQISQLHMEVDRISKELEAALTERKGGPVDITSLRNQLATRLTDALAVQKISQDEFNRFWAELASIDKQIASMKGADGSIPTNDQLHIALAIDNLSQRFTAGEHQRQADMSAIDQRKDELRAMIREGVAAGQLTEDEVDDLRQQLYNFDEKEVHMGLIGRPLTGDEEVSMALELERFGAEIRARMDNGTSVTITERTVDHRRAVLDQTFANALFGGEISVAEATDFKQSLDQIVKEEAAIRKENGGHLPAADVKTLLISVEKLKGRFSRLTFNRKKPWGGVDGLVNDIKQKITVAGANNQLSAQEVDDLQSKIADELVAKSNERNVQGFITTDSALRLQTEIGNLAKKVTDLIAERSTVSLDSVVKKEKDLDRRIATSIDSGKLTPVMAAPIMVQFKNVQATVAKIKSTATGAITPSAQAALSSVATDMENLIATIKTSEDDNVLPLVSIDQLKSDVDREISARTVNGRLSPAEGQKMRAQYNRINALEKSSRARAGGLDAISANNLRTELVNLMKNTRGVKTTAASPAY